MWIPISETELYDEIAKTEALLNDDLRNFWQLIKIGPEKWPEDAFGKDGGGFWVVALCGRRLIWYNDIEDGFNISTYSTYGHIDEYWCNQSELNEAVIRLYSLIQFGGELFGQLSGPKTLAE